MGPFTVAQARASGVADAEMRRLLRGGVWVTLRRGVYVERRALDAARVNPERWHALQIAALLLALECDAVAAGTSAARILGLETLRPMPGELVVVTGEPVRHKRRDGYLLRSAELPRHHRASRHGVPITSGARTVADLARWLPLTEAVVIADSALRLGRMTLPELEAALRDCHDWSGIGRARQVRSLVDPNAESVLETVSRVAMYEQALPMPQTQVVIGDEARPVARVDFYWRQYGVIGEADGLGKYEPRGGLTTREIVRSEKRREERLADLGFEIVRWGWEDARNPPRLACRLRAAFARAAERRRDGA